MGSMYIDHDHDHEPDADGRTPGRWFAAVVSALVGLPGVLAITRARSVAVPTLTVVVRSTHDPLVELRAALWGQAVLATQPARALVRIVPRRDPDEVLLYERNPTSRPALPPPAPPPKAPSKPRRPSPRPAARPAR